MTKKERYDYRRANGLCVQCGKPSGGRCRCEVCSKRQNENQNNRREIFRSRGLCPYCGGEIDDSRYALCSRCRQMNRKSYYETCENGEKGRHKRYKQRRKQRLKAGICVYCGKNPAVDGKTACQSCLDDHAERARQYRKMKAYDKKFFKKPIYSKTT